MPTIHRGKAEAVQNKEAQRGRIADNIERKGRGYTKQVVAGGGITDTTGRKGRCYTKQVVQRGSPTIQRGAANAIRKK